MLKKRNFLKMISGITSCLAICGIFCCSIFFRSDKNILNVKADGGFPSTQIQNIDNYSMVGNFTGKFDFNWSYLTYDNEESNESRSKLRLITNKPTSLRGLVWVANKTVITRDGLTGGNYTYGNGCNVHFYTSGNFNYSDNSFSEWGAFSLNVDYPNYAYTQVKFNRTYGDGNGQVAFDGSSQNPVSKWFNSLMNVWYIIDDPTSGIPTSQLIDWMWENGTLYNWYDFYLSSLEYQSTIDSLESEVSELEDEIETLESQITLLESEISELEDEVESLTEELNNLVATSREGLYIVNVNSHYELTYNLYWNLGDSNDFYIKPSSMKVVTDVDVSDGNGDGVEFRHGLVDELTLSSNQNIYYYTPTQCLTFLHIGADENTDLLRVYFYTGNNSEFGVFNLTHVNNFISNYQLDVMSDISYTSNILFRSQLIYYKDVILTLDDFSNGAYQTGYDDGYSVGFINGNNQGYSEGRSEGYQAGLETNGTVVSIFSGILQVAMVPVNFFLAIFNFEILGINISSFIQALLTIFVTIIVLRTIFGGKGGSES